MRLIQRGWQAAGVLALALLVSPTAMVQAASPEGAGVATAVSGEVTVSHAVSPAPQALHFKDEVLYRDRISTAARSLARLLLGKKALVTVRELSELQLIDLAGTSTVHLVLGKIAIGVARQRMRPGETVEIRTQNAVAAIRGTVVVAERLTPPGGSDPVTRLHVLSGYIDVTTPGNPGAPPLRLVAPSSLTVTGNTMDRPVPLNAAARAALLSDLQPTQPLPTRVLGSLVRGEQARAAGLARIITGDRNGGGERVDVQGPPVDVQAPTTPVTPPTPSTPSAGPSSSPPFIFNNQSPELTGDLYTVRGGSPQNIFTDFLEATNSTVTVGGSPQLSPTANGFVAQNHGTVGLDGGLVDAANPQITSSADFVLGAGKGQFIVTGPAAPLVSLTGGTEEPIQHSGGFLDLNAAAVTTARAVRVDVALLEASAPLLNLSGASGSQLTTSGNAIDLTSKAKVTNTAAFVTDLPGDFRTKGSSREWRPPGRRGSRAKGAVYRKADGRDSEGSRSTARGRGREEARRR
ncbi:MAG: FecR domain-containing protein [Candidatus Rokubacteria bacterium]|nr:FecR domain-containing protein [Candidatus Rokubacteria bacterium]